MHRNGELIRCQQRKAALLKRSAVHRAALADDLRSLRPVAAWVDLGVGIARNARAGWAAFLPLLSLWRTSRQAAPGILPKIASALSLARTLLALWKSSREATPQPGGFAKDVHTRANAAKR